MTEKSHFSTHGFISQEVMKNIISENQEVSVEIISENLEKIFSIDDSNSPSLSKSDTVIIFEKKI